MLIKPKSKKFYRCAPVWGKAVAAGPTTIFAATLTGNDTIGGNFTIRVVKGISAGAGALSQVRATITAGGTTGLDTDHCAVGIWSGTNADCTLTPIELTFGGLSGFSIAGGTTKTSDFVTLGGFTGSDKLVVIADYAVAGANFATGSAGAASTGSDVGAYFKGGASYNAATLAAPNAIGAVPYLVTKIEVQ